MNIESHLQAFVGYVELQMYSEANDELENLPAELKAHHSVLLARLDLLMEMSRWEAGVILGESLCILWPNEFEFWFRTGYCLHVLKRTQEAKDTLLAAPATIRSTAVFHYNLACYEAQLGNLDAAKQLLKTSCVLDAKHKTEALDDPDLAPIWDSLEKR